MKKMLTVALVLVMTLSLCACGPTKEEVAGTYTGTYKYEGNTFSTAIVLSEDGIYVKATEKNGGEPSITIGDYEIDGNKVILYDPDSVVYHGVRTDYKYSNGTLKNGGHKFSK